MRLYDDTSLQTLIAYTQCFQGLCAMLICVAACSSLLRYIAVLLTLRLLTCTHMRIDSFGVFALAASGSSRSEGRQRHDVSQRCRQTYRFWPVCWYVRFSSFSCYFSIFALSHIVFRLSKYFTQTHCMLVEIFLPKLTFLTFFPPQTCPKGRERTHAAPPIGCRRKWSCTGRTLSVCIQCSYL